MISATSRPLWGFLCAALLSLGPLVTPAQAAQWYSGWGYGTYYRAPYSYAPYSYTAGYGGYGYTAGYRYTAGYGYGGYGGCCLTSLFHGCGLFGCYRPTYASYYAPAYASSACGSGCSPCDPCGNACIGGNCPTGDCGIASSPSTYSGEPATDSQSSPTPANSPSTYAPKSLPEENMTDPSDGFVLPQSEEGDTPSDPGGVDIERGVDWDSNKAPAEAEPDAAEGLEADGDAAQPLNLEVQLVYRLQPQRSRAHYRAVFRAPHVARTDVPARSEWTPVKSDAHLASTK